MSHLLRHALPIWMRLRIAITDLALRLGALSTMAYLAALSFIGVDVMIALISFSAVWPAALPPIVIALAAAAGIRSWWRRRRATTDRETGNS
ncbi:hypothetical protein [Williamsia sterculiae]|uniref:Uncharacterized protein n=1 Tax=Williamsia sterculiae TaxID=1344003 RepID=A0A1N7F378_9NOCA|nr:hypothetical protein [Williamsia sterculiae]SIR94739.1 hypothetical protein SAMN05445060_1760 [Williamsia sterculiae]